MKTRKLRTQIGDADRSTEGHGHVALVTGASSGIGRAMAELLAAKGYDVIPVARRGERLEDLRTELTAKYGISVHPIVADLADPATPARIAKELANDNLTVDFLVNNAGYSIHGLYTDFAWEEEERFIRVNALGAIELTHRLLPAMVEQGWGRILNVNSIASQFAGSPQMVLYTAAKSMLHKFTVGLAEDFGPRGVNCTASVPGFTDTELFEVAGISNWSTTSPFGRAAMMSPTTVARQAYTAVMTGKREIVHGWHHKIWAAILVHSPAPVRYKLVLWTSKVMDH